MSYVRKHNRPRLQPSQKKWVLVRLAAIRKAHPNLSREQAFDEVEKVLGVDRRTVEYVLKKSQTKQKYGHKTN